MRNRALPREAFRVRRLPRNRRRKGGILCRGTAREHRRAPEGVDRRSCFGKTSPDDQPARRFRHQPETDRAACGTDCGNEKTPSPRFEAKRRHGRQRTDEENQRRRAEIADRGRRDDERSSPSRRQQIRQVGKHEGRISTERNSRDHPCSNELADPRGQRGRHGGNRQQCHRRQQHQTPSEPVCEPTQRWRAQCCADVNRCKQPR